jgi:hypothetical protein
LEGNANLLLAGGFCNPILYQFYWESYISVYKKPYLNHQVGFLLEILGVF